MRYLRSSIFHQHISQSRQCEYRQLCPFTLLALPEVEVGGSYRASLRRIKILPPKRLFSFLTKNGRIFDHANIIHRIPYSGNNALYISIQRHVISCLSICAFLHCYRKYSSRHYRSFDDLHSPMVNQSQYECLDRLRHLCQGVISLRVAASQRKQ